jgi:hypothetical protein
MIQNSPSPTETLYSTGGTAITSPPLAFPALTHTPQLTFEIGVNAPAATSLDLWFDEIELSTLPLACP